MCIRDRLIYTGQTDRQTDHGTCDIAALGCGLLIYTGQTDRQTDHGTCDIAALGRADCFCTRDRQTDRPRNV